MPNTVQEALQAFAGGELVVVTDADREGEGDLIVAASLCTPAKMAFIIRHTSGIVCTPITAEDARRRLDPMVAHNESNHSTAFFTGSERMNVVLQHFKRAGRGVLVYLRDGAAGMPVEPFGEPASAEADRHRQWRVGARLQGPVRFRHRDRRQRTP